MQIKLNKIANKYSENHLEIVLHYKAAVQQLHKYSNLRYRGLQLDWISRKNLKYKVKSIMKSLWRWTGFLSNPPSKLEGYCPQVSELKARSFQSFSKRNLNSRHNPDLLKWIKLFFFNAQCYDSLVSPICYVPFLGH